MESILVVGFGNELVGDDGIGPAVARRLVGAADGLRSVVGHTDALRLPGYWCGERRVWLVDALERGGRPGSVHRVEHEELLRVPQRHATAHQLSLAESLRWIAHAYPEMSAVRYTLWGVEPGALALGSGLSAAVAAAVDVVAEEIRRAARALLPGVVVAQDQVLDADAHHGLPGRFDLG